MLPFGCKQAFTILSLGLGGLFKPPKPGVACAVIHHCWEWCGEPKVSKSGQAERLVGIGGHVCQVWGLAISGDAEGSREGV